MKQSKQEAGDRSPAVEDPYRAFLASAAAEVPGIHRDSRIVRLVGAPTAGGAPAGYAGVLHGVEHFERRADGTVSVTDRDVLFSITFPSDYLRSVDPKLQFRIVRMQVPIFHPNHSGGTLCLGGLFRPGTRLRPLVEQIHLVVSGRIAATDHGFDADACEYFLAHRDEVTSLVSPPLWGRPVATGTRVEDIVASGDRL